MAETCLVVATDDEDEIKADDDDRTTQRATPLRLNSDAVDLSIFFILQRCSKIYYEATSLRVEIIIARMREQTMKEEEIMI